MRIGGGWGGGGDGDNTGFLLVVSFSCGMGANSRGGGVKQITIRGTEENDATERHRGEKKHR